jgi:SAM-dependent methyltransferase
MLRERILKAYISSSAGPQRPLARSDLDAFNRAYRYYLRGWVPSEVKGGWLDLGCGQGTMMRLAATFGYQEVVGVDISEEMLATCHADGLRVEAEDVWKYLERTPNERWDVVSAFDILEHFSKDDGFQLLREVRRVLKPGGTCFVKVPNAASPWGYEVTASDLTHEASYSPYSLMQLATIAGFNKCEVREVGPAPGSLASRARGAMWLALRSLYAALNVIETGSPGSGVYTRVMVGKLTA